MSTSQGEFVIGITYDFNPNTIDGIDRQIVFGEEMSRRIGVRRFQREGINFPHRGRCGAGRGEVTWGPLDLFRVLQILHNPRYAGAFVFGRTRVKRTADLKSKTQVQVARDDWGVLIHGAHAGYISWEEFERNQVTLKCNLAALSPAGRGAVPREGGALLQGRAMLCIADAFYCNYFCAPCKGTVFQWVRTPPGTLSLQPVAIGAVAQGVSG